METSRWHELECNDSDQRIVTEGMNVSGGCLVRTVTWQQGVCPTGVSQTFLSNMHVEEIREDGRFKYVLTSGKDMI